MESFYGGRQGASFVIKGRFKYITDGVDQNGKYVDPYYGQAIAELEKLKAYETAKAAGETLSDDQMSLLPKKSSGEPYTVEEWETDIAAETMSIQLNNYNYKNIWYGEYCIIDPRNKNNKNNGKIYRRTLKGAGDEDIDGGVAEYIGQIVGPAGPPTQLKDIDGVDAIEESFDHLPLGQDDVIGFLNEDGQWSETRISTSNIYVNKLGKKAKMLAGDSKVENYPNHEKDYFTIKGEGDNVITKTYLQNGGYNWYNVRLNTSTDDISEIQVGFDIPYFVVDIEAGDVLPDVAPVEIVRTINTIAAPHGEAPFYEKYKINIPRGLRGAWFDNIHTIERKEKDSDNKPIKYYYPNAVSYQTPNYNFDQKPTMDTTYPENPTHYQEDGFYFHEAAEVPLNVWPLGAKGWVADFHWRTKDKKQLGNDSVAGVVHTVQNIFLGLDRDIKDIIFDDNGTLTFEYTAWTQDNSNDYENQSTDIGDFTTKYRSWFKKVDWIKKIEIDRTPSVNYGTDSSDLDADDSSVTQGDNLKITFNNNTVSGTENGVYEKNLRTIAGIKTFDDGSLRVYRSDGSKNDFPQRINWITDINIDNNDKLSVQMNNNNVLENGKLEKNLRLLKEINLYENGVLETIQSDGTIRSSNQLNSNGEKDEDNRINLGSQLSWIKEVYRTSSTGKQGTYKDGGEKVGPFHLLIRFNNLIPGESTGLKQVSLSDPDDSSFVPQNDWFDLGLVQETLDGIYFSEEDVSIEYTTNQNGEQIAAATLMDRYENGLDGKAIAVRLTEKNPDNGTIVNTKTVVFYYVGSQNGQPARWEKLTSIEGTSSVVIDETGINAAENAIHFIPEKIKESEFPVVKYYPWWPAAI